MIPSGRVIARSFSSRGSNKDETRTNVARSIAAAARNVAEHRGMDLGVAALDVEASDGLQKISSELLSRAIEALKRERPPADELLLLTNWRVVDYLLSP